MIKPVQKIQILPDQAALAQEASKHFINCATQAMREKKSFSVALAGGSTPRALYSSLAENYQDQIDWEYVHIFWGDERCVAPDHKDSNYRMARETLLDHVPVPLENIHRMPGELPPEEAGKIYEKRLRSFFNDPDTINSSHPLKTFDLLLLGIGSDGHTASLFPGTSALEESTRWVVSVPHKEPPPPLVTRLSLTLPAINAAKQVTFLVAGTEKAAILRKILVTEPIAINALPAARVQPIEGELLWLLDSAAAELL